MGFLEARARYRRIAARFPVSIWIRGYIVGKLASDPAFASVLELVRNSSTPILDVGCGYGLLAHYLREARQQMPIHGLDLDAAKIDCARIAANRARLHAITFEAADAADSLVADNTVVLLDVIHYLDAESQQRLLARLAAHPGLIILRTAPRDLSWRFRLVQLQEWWTHASGWIPVGDHANFLSIEEICAPFRAAGRSLDVRPLWGRTPFNSHLFLIEPVAVEAGQA